MLSCLKSNSYQERSEKLKLKALEKRRMDQDSALIHKMLSDARFCEKGALKQFGETGGITTRMAPDPKNLVS
jgi:hypothetical protein